MQYTITAPKSVKGCIVLPASKSISNRALTINSLSGSNIPPSNISDCDDTRVMCEWMEERPLTVDIGAADTAMRFSTALLAVTEGKHVITGSERMKNRPIAVLVDALRQLGAHIEYVEKTGFPPLEITGNPDIEGGRISLPGDISSQYISALLMIGPKLSDGLTLELTGSIVSRPYINMTLAIMKEFGACAAWTTDNIIEVKAGGYSPREYFVENDWSAASYWYEMVALIDDMDAEILLPNLFKESMQGDSKGTELFRRLGVETAYSQEGVLLRKSGKVTDRLDYDFVDIPDLAQTFTVTCCMLGIPFHFKGLQSLKIKETDRINALKVEMRKLGYVLEDRNDSELIWQGQRCEPENDVAIDTYEDHRMAMAFAPAAIKTRRLRINNPQVVSKSYPHFWEDLKSVGFSI